MERVLANKWQTQTMMGTATQLAHRDGSNEKPNPARGSPSDGGGVLTPLTLQWLPHGVFKGYTRDSDVHILGDQLSSIAYGFHVK